MKIEIMILKFMQRTKSSQNKLEEEQSWRTNTSRYERQTKRPMNRAQK